MRLRSAFKYSVFDASKLVSTKTLLLKHRYRRQGFYTPPPPLKGYFQGAVKGIYLKGLFAQSRLFYREMDCPVRFYREMDCPVRWSLATPSALESQSRAEQGSVVGKSHLQVQPPQGRSLASASGSGQAIDMCFERSPFK